MDESTLKHRDKMLTEEFGELIGKKVLGLRALSKEEADQFGWSVEHGGMFPWCIIFEGDLVIIPTSDPEGNEAGFAYLADLGAK